MTKKQDTRTKQFINYKIQKELFGIYLLVIVW